jgi:hypothetical protein
VTIATGSSWIGAAFPNEASATLSHVLAERKPIGIVRVSRWTATVGRVVLVRMMIAD